MSSDLVVRAVPLLPMEPDQAALMMHRFKELCEAILTPDDIIGDPGGEGFVKRSGWQKLATFYSISTAILQQSEYRDGEGDLVRAKATVRATHPNGRSEDGDGACSRSEQRFRNPAGRQKIEHDLPATAVTRARNRAISNLVGFGKVSAEEVEGEGGPGPAAARPYGPAASEAEEERLLAALFDLQVGPVVANDIEAKYGYLPKVCARSIMVVAAALRDKAEDIVVDANGAEPAPEAGSGEDTPADTETVE